jgi:D-alanyl-D-alanine carboxypeptidase
MAQLNACKKSLQIQRSPILRGFFSALPTRFLVFSVAILAALLTISSPRIAQAKYAAIVVDAGTGAIRHETNADDRNPPASLTKLMTLYLLFEAIENKRIGWDTMMTTSRHAANQSPTHLALAPGETLSVHDAVMGVIIQSANDAAVVIAETLAGGNEDQFALMMTAKARKLGMSRTTFRNASGLPHAGQLSTARDMATLAQAMMDRFPQYYPMFSESSFTYKGRPFHSHNRVTLNYPGADGLKTGFTNASGFNIVTSAKRDGYRVIGVVFGGNTTKARDQQMEKLLDQTFANHRNGTGAVIAKNTVPEEAAPVLTKPRIHLTAPVQQAGLVNPKTIKTKKKPVFAQGDAEVASATSANGDWGIQVGAFYAKAPAQTTAHDVTHKYAKLLHGSQINVTPLAKSKGRTLYRARIMGIDKDAAYEVCKQLKRADKPCMELRGNEDQEVAER